jgi:hypothetical protein
MTKMDFKTFYFIKNKENQKFDTFNYAIKKTKDLILDKIGIIQFVKFMYPLYDRTFFKSIKFGYCWKNGTKLEFKYNENLNGYSVENEKKLWDIIQNSLENISSDNEKFYGVGNSGGLDSRLIIFILNKLNKKLIGYTFGDTPSDAVYIANKTAKKLKIRNENIKIEYDFLQKYWMLIVNKKPMHNLIYSWYYSAFQNLPSFDINITGFNGDNMLGSHLTNHLLYIKRLDQLYRYIYDHYGVISDDRLKYYLKDKNLINQSYSDYLKNIQKSDNTKNENIFEEFNFKCRQLRFIINSINFDFCGNHRWDSPFCSKEFMNLALNLTFKERYQKNLYFNTARKYMKELVNFRFERTFNSLKDKNKFKISIKRIFWGLDNKLNLRLYYRGSHKNVQKWLLASNSLEFMKDILRKPLPIFDEIFNSNLILRDINLLFKENIHFLFNILSVKLWLEKNLKNL